MFIYSFTVILIAIAILLLSSLFVGLGFILAQIYHFSLFEATLICLLTSLVLSVSLLVIRLLLNSIEDDSDDEFNFEDSDKS